MITGAETADLVQAPSSLLVSAFEHEQEDMYGKIERLVEVSDRVSRFHGCHWPASTSLRREPRGPTIAVITSDAYVNVLLLDPTGPSQPGTAFEEKLMDRLSNSFQVLLQNHR